MRSFFFRVAVITVALIIIPSCIFSAFLYFRFSAEISTLLRESKISRLEKLQSELNDVLFNANLLLINLSVNENIKPFYESDFAADRYKALLVYDEIRKSMGLYSYIDSIYMHFYGSEEIVTNEGFSRLSNFYDSQWKITPPKDRSKYVLLPAREISYIESGHYKTKKIITMIRFIPTFGSTAQGALVLNLNYGEIQQRLLRYLDKDDDTILAVDKDNNIVVSSDIDLEQNTSGDMPKFSVKNNIRPGYSQGIFLDYPVSIVYTETSDNGLKVMELSRRPISDEISPIIKDILKVLLVLMIAPAIVVAVYVIRGTYLSFIGSYSILTKAFTDSGIGFPESKNEPEFIKSSINTLLHSYKCEKNRLDGLEKHFKESGSQLLNNIFIAIISKGYCDNVQESTLLSFGWNAPMIVVMTVSIDQGNRGQERLSHDKRELYNIGLKKVIQSIIKTDTSNVVLQIYPDEFIVITGLSQDDALSAYEHMPVFASQIQKEAALMEEPLSVSIGISDICDDIFLLASYYQESLSALKYRWIKGRWSITTFNELVNGADYEYYPLENENKIIQLLKQGELSQSIKEFRIFVQDLLSENSYNSQPCYEGILQFACALGRIFCQSEAGLNTIVKNREHRKYYNIISDIADCETIWDAQERFCVIFKIITEFIAEKRVMKSCTSIKEIVKYVDEHFCEQIYLSTLSQIFNVSESYLSRSFKQSTNENFLDYLNRLRVNKAQILLKDTDMNVAEVANVTGYGNVQTFQRIFKKIAGITAGQFRHLCRSKLKES